MHLIAVNILFHNAAVGSNLPIELGWRYQAIRSLRFAGSERQRGSTGWVRWLAHTESISRTTEILL
jgi:hypothetical protein